MRTDIRLINSEIALERMKTTIRVLEYNIGDFKRGRVDPSTFAEVNRIVKDKLLDDLKEVDLNLLCDQIFSADPEIDG